MWTQWYETSAYGWLQKGNDAVENEEYDKAISFYLRSIELNPDYASAYYNLGNAYDDNGDFATALIYYKTAAKLGDKNAQDWLKKNGHDW